MKEIRIASLTAVTWLLILALFTVWGAGMYCLTSVTAEYAAARYLKDYGDFASVITSRSLEPWLGKGHSVRYENYDRNRLWEAADDGGRANYFSSSGLRTGEDDRHGFIRRRDSRQAYSAVAVYDGEGNLLECSWSDFFYFEYLTEEQWNNREERTGNHARAFFDREKLTEEGRMIVSDSRLTFEAAAMRFTGCFDGTEFTPQKIEYIRMEDYEKALHSKGAGQYTVSGIVENYDLPWIPIYDDPAGGEIVTFYSDWYDVCYNENSPAFTFAGRDYDNAAALADELGPALTAGKTDYTEFSGPDLLITSVNYCYSFEGETYYTPHYHGADAYGEDKPGLHFYTFSTVYCSPWRTAAGELIIIYLVTFLLTAALLLVLRCLIKRHLILPAQIVGETLMSEEEGACSWTKMSEAWYESRLLQEGCRKNRDRLRMQKNEIARLNAALEYAKTAEENRRQMTSNIAHELKTPMAVIHSYAEGLKERIAEDKRDKYVDVILSEVQRTDIMVLEMLDLSRLEAGKVKLSRDEFSLADLTVAIFEKLEMATEAKKLKISFEFPEQSILIADENRIAQVVENFATNAVKYTPAGGHIAVRIRNRRGKTIFSVENDSEPLSDEALSKVWDTFYRAEESRSGEGTGLGLAIAKNIIELHRGECSARNTASGVEFMFTI